MMRKAWRQIRNWFRRERVIIVHIQQVGIDPQRTDDAIFAALREAERRERVIIVHIQQVGIDPQRTDDAIFAALREAERRGRR